MDHTIFALSKWKGRYAGLWLALILAALAVDRISNQSDNTQMEAEK